MVGFQPCRPCLLPVYFCKEISHFDDQLQCSHSLSRAIKEELTHHLVFIVSFLHPHLSKSLSCWPPELMMIDEVVTGEVTRRYFFSSFHNSSLLRVAPCLGGGGGDWWCLCWCAVQDDWRYWWRTASSLSLSSYNYQLGLSDISW